MVNISSTEEATNRFQMYMNRIRQQVNSKWKQKSNNYSKLLIRFPWSILGISSFLTIGLTIYFLLFMEIRSFDPNDFVIPNGKAMKNAYRIREIFGDDTQFRAHQQLNVYPALDLIIKRKSNTNHTNMLSYQIVDEIRLLDKQIQSIRINNLHEYNYSSLCIKIHHACMIDGNYILTDKFRQDVSYLLPPKHNYYFDSSGANGVPAFMFGKTYHMINMTQNNTDYDEHEENEDSKEIVETSFEKIISYVALFRLRYSLNVTTKEMKQLALQWEREVLRYLNEEYKSDLIDLFPSTSEALPDAIAKKTHQEGIYIALMMFIFLFFYYLFLCIQGNFHTSVGYLPFCGIISIGLSTGATFGLLTLFRIQIFEPMTLLVFIVIIIDCIRTSIVCGEYHRIINDHTISLSDMSSEIDIEKILPSIMESTHPYFLTSTLIITVVYVIFTFVSPIIPIRLICSTLPFYIIVNYLVHLSFFSSCLVITLKRVSSRRHSFLCYRLPTNYYTNLKQRFPQLKLLKTQISSLFNNNLIFKKFFTSILCLLFVIFLISSIWFGVSIDTRLYDDKFLPSDAYSLRKYMESQMNDFHIGPVVMFTIPQEIDYQNDQIKSSMNSLINQCQNEARIGTFKLLWLDNEDVNNILYGKDDLKIRITPLSENDLVVSQNSNSSSIIASRFYCQYKTMQGDREDMRIMKNMYTYARKNLIPSVFPFSLLFPKYEALEQIRFEIYLLIILLLLSILIMTSLSFIAFKKSLMIFTHILALITGTFTCLYLFNDLTFNFANAIWLYIIPIIFIDIFIHIAFHQTNTKWKYNRIILSLVLALIILYLVPIQSYVFRIIRYSLLYQSIICLILINLIIPSWNYLFQSMNKNDNQVNKPTIAVIEGNQALTNDLEINSSI